ncbi:hypothetical protein RZN05_00880 [Sphingomonas sp. HF-S4]|uniref:Uncharacterized protein n=1 Tax=Sphingomonas agrestis TaxID=3080540 RepID=A0ABU3Y2B1_9SPHN|nr:hypothetical protein [Sphingomonas sp. HF-S4]MDV3455520.1 hypothetical protein [Sphingomonas sp. HF-S4]
MLIAAVLLQAAVAAPAFAPPLDTPLRIVAERIETSPVERRYRLERLVRFHREGEGYRAEAVLLANATSGPEALGNLVERGLTALAGRTIVLHLDSRGQVIEVDDMAALWERVCAHIAEAVSSRRSLSPDESSMLATRLVAPLRALPPDRRRALLATLVTAAITADPVEAPGATAAVELPGTSPFGTPLTLAGTRRTEAAGSLLRITTTATATVTLPPEGPAPARTGSVSLKRIRTVDPRTGLLATATDTVRNLAGTRETRLVTHTRVEIASPSAWPR